MKSNRVRTQTIPKGLRPLRRRGPADRKSTRLNSSHLVISYAVFCLKKQTDEASGIPPEYGQGVQALGRLGSRYWFDALILVGIVLGIVVAHHDLSRPNGPNGPFRLD